MSDKYSENDNDNNIMKTMKSTTPTKATTTRAEKTKNDTVVINSTHLIKVIAKLNKNNSHLITI